MSGTTAHSAAIDELRTLHNRSWGQTALLSCLERLRSGGPTSAEEVTVVDAWAFDDGFCVIYGSPWGPTAGLRVTATGEQYSGACTDHPSAEEFGMDIADFSIAEPLGRFADRLVLDAGGVGDPPFPSGSVHRHATQYQVPPPSSAGSAR
ncbi:hypothetical protein ACF1AJ_19010 [Leifsonia sp. NPDC014704]|uniref:hypothetical protein n=1 Tax=Leifsonia sp. NPDC014704 TaxID=3364123 RepID=UPI0036F4856C